MGNGLIATLGSLVTERYWQLRRGAPSAPPTWRPDPRLLEVSEFEWPSRYARAPAEKWMVHVHIGLSDWVLVRRKMLSQDYSGIALARLLVDGRAYEIAFDYSDYPIINEECARRVAVYFKMQHPVGGFPGSSNVYPGGFVPASPMIYGALSSLRRLRERGEFHWDVYGRFGLEAGVEIRSRALALLTDQTSFRFLGGAGRVRYSQYLREAAAAQVCIDLPGNGDLCFRLIDYLAVGACVVAVQPRNRLHVLLEDRIHVAYVRPDLSDLLSTCEYYLKHPDERERLSRNARDFFDRYSHPRQLAGYYLQTAFEHLKLA